MTVPAVPPMTSPGTEVPALAFEPRLMDRFAEDVRRCGVVGEARICRTVFLALVSRLLDRPVSVIVKGHSASGKSHEVESTVGFFHTGAYISLTGMSEKALVYMDEDYAHRTLVIKEADGLRESADDNLTAYLLRSLLSEGHLEYSVTVRGSDGGWTAKTIRKDGPTNVILTTVRTRIEHQNETRALSLGTDDTRAQTQRILQQLATEYNASPDLTGWHELHAWLQEHGERRVTIPYAARLADLVPPVAVRLRRDFGAVLSLIRAHALLHQATRDRDTDGRVVASLDDYETVRDLIASVVSEGVGATVPETVRETVTAVADLAATRPEGVTALDLATVLNLDKSAARRRLYVASSDGYVVNQEDRRGRPGRWVIGEPLPDEVEILPTTENLERKE